MGKANKAESGAQRKSNGAESIVHEKTNEAEPVVQRKTKKAKPAVQGKSNEAEPEVEQKTTEAESSVQRKPTAAEVLGQRCKEKTYEVLETYYGLILFHVNLEWPDCVRTLDEETKSLGSEGKSVWEGPAHKKLTGTLRHYQSSQEDWDLARKILAAKAPNKSRGDLHLPEDEIKRKFECTKHIMFFQGLSRETLPARDKRLLVKMLNVLSKKEQERKKLIFSATFNLTKSATETETLGLPQQHSGSGRRAHFKRDGLERWLGKPLLHQLRNRYRRHHDEISTSSANPK